MDFAGKKVLVCGIAKSGIAAAALLCKLGAHVTLQDIKESDKLNLDFEFLHNIGVKLYLGKNPDDILEQMDLVVVSPGIPCDLPFFAEAERLHVEVIGEIELAYRLCKCPIVAITGTNGKTTTTALAGEIIKNYITSAEIVGNIGIPFTERVEGIDENGIVIAEISSFQLETIKNFHPMISAVLNITPDHLNRHKSFDNYVKIKERVFLNQNEKDYVILNYDDKIVREMKDKTKARVLFFSVKEKLNQGIFLSSGDMIFKVDGTEINLLNVNELKILGDHNAANAMAAILIAYAAGVPLKIICDTVKSFKPLQHRIEFVRELNGIEFYNDSKGTNTDCAIKSIEAMRRKIVLIGGGYDKGADFSDWVKAFDNKVKHLIVMGEVSDKIIETCKTYSFINYDKVNSLRSAVELAYSKASVGDCVLLSPACASWDMFDSYEQRGDMFKQFVMDLR